jgi:hypothetical protein
MTKPIRRRWQTWVSAVSGALGAVLWWLDQLDRLDWARGVYADGNRYWLVRFGVAVLGWKYLSPALLILGVGLLLWLVLERRRERATVTASPRPRSWLEPGYDKAALKEIVNRASDEAMGFGPPHDVQDDTRPRLILESHRCITAAKLVGGSGPTQTLAALQICYARITIKNDPLVGGAFGVAKNVTAHTVFSTRVGHHLTVEAEWDRGKPINPNDPIDNYSGGGTNVWFNVGQRRDIILAFKLIDDVDAYAIREQPHVSDLEVRAPGLALPPGDYRVVVEVRSDTSPLRDDFSFTLRHSGKGSAIELHPVATVSN